MSVKLLASWAFLSTSGLCRGLQDLPQTGIMLQDIVVAKRVKSPSRGVRSRVRRQRKVVQQLCDVITDVDTLSEGVFNLGKREVAPFARKEAVVRQCVEHGARASRWTMLAIAVASTWGNT